MSEHFGQWKGQAMVMGDEVRKRKRKIYVFFSMVGNVNIGVYKNRGTPKSSILIGVPLFWKHPYETTFFLPSFAMLVLVQPLMAVAKLSLGISCRKFI